MYIVTGGAGFIGANIVLGLNARGINDIVVVDDLSDGKKFSNLVDCDIADYQDYEDFLLDLQNGKLPGEKIKAIFHQGACSTTTEWNGRFMMRVNYEYSKQILHFCLQHQIQMIYASSAAVYGASTIFKELPEFEKPLNVYGYSKLQFDRYVRRHCLDRQSQVVGLRYFNVYGPYENHKGSMASVAFHLMNQLRDFGRVQLFEGCGDYGDGEQRRDFVFVDDVVKVNLWVLDNPQVNGIFNVGTGASQPFNAIAYTLLAEHGSGELQYIPFPEHLKGAYQDFTEADISALRAAGYQADFDSLQSGLQQYSRWYWGTARKRPERV